MFHFGARWVRANPGKGSFSVGSISAYIAGESHWLGQRLSRPHQPYEIACVGLAVPEGVTRDKVHLWQAADQMERRKDGEYQRRAGKTPRLAVHIDAALPLGLSTQQADAVAAEFANALVGRFGVIAQYAVHNKADSPNDHIHVLISTRSFREADFGRKVRELDGIAQRKKELADGKPLIVETRDGQRQISGEMEWMRATWASLIARYAHKPIDHRSFARQGLPYAPVSILRRGEIEFEKRLERRGIPHQPWREKRSQELQLRDIALPWPSASPKQLTLSQQRAQRRRAELRRNRLAAHAHVPSEPAIAPAFQCVDVALGTAQEHDGLTIGLDMYKPRCSSGRRSQKTQQRRMRLRELKAAPPTIASHDPLSAMQPQNRSNSAFLIANRTGVRRARFRFDRSPAASGFETAEARLARFRDDCINGVEQRGRATISARIAQDGRRAGDLELSRLRIAMQTAILAQTDAARLRLASDPEAIEMFRRFEREQHNLVAEGNRIIGLVIQATPINRQSILKVRRNLRKFEDAVRALNARQEKECQTLQSKMINEMAAFPSWRDIGVSTPPIAPVAYSLIPSRNTLGVLRDVELEELQHTKFQAILAEAAYRMHIHNQLTRARMTALSAAARLELEPFQTCVQKIAEKGVAPRHLLEIADSLSEFSNDKKLALQIIIGCDTAIKSKNKKTSSNIRAKNKRFVSDIAE